MYPDPHSAIVSDILLDGVDVAAFLGPLENRPGLIVRTTIEPDSLTVSVSVHVAGPGGILGRLIAHRVVLARQSNENSIVAMDTREAFDASEAFGGQPDRTDWSASS